MKNMTEKKVFVPSFDNIAFTENGAVSYKTTGAAIVDQFGKAANYRGRDINAVFKEQEALWLENHENAVRFPFYLRLVTRKVKVNGENVTDKVQKGQGVRDESFKRLLWLAEFQPDTFYKNIWALPLVGSWKDVWTILFYDITIGHNVIDHTIIFDLINEGLKCGTHTELIKKFMPRIETRSKCKTDWRSIRNDLAREFANYNKLSYKDYNRLKTSGKAHDFQKLICSGRFKDINWNLIPGRALSKLASQKFLTKHELEKGYIDWVKAQPTVKFTGYVYELMKEISTSNGWRTSVKNLPLFKKITVDKQFDELIKKAEADGKITDNVWCALDTSGSMGIQVIPGTSAFDICVSLGVFFATLNKGAFHKNVIMFDTVSHVKQLPDAGFCDMVSDIYNSATAWGSTNFQSVVDEIVRIRKSNPKIPLEDYPTTLLVVSDMQFNPVGANVTTNYIEMKKKLYEVFPQEFVDNMKFIWWQVTGRTKDVPAEIGTGQIFLSGFDGSVVSLILGGEAKEIEKEKGRPITTEEAIGIALNQEILSYITV
jgi:hypothetical protein